MKRSIRRRKKRWSFIFMFIFFSFSLFFLDSHLLPQLKEISHMQCKAVSNNIIDEAILSNLKSLSVSDLLLKEEGFYQANTTQVNLFCALLSNEITNNFSDLKTESIRIPLGSVTGLSLLSNAGPDIPFTLLPMGAVMVDYETEFDAAGINQMNYKIWLNISMEMKIVNPLYQETLFMERKIMLADLIFSGKVPDHYFQMTSPGEYLLTE